MFPRLAHRGTSLCPVALHRLLHTTPSERYSGVVVAVQTHLELKAELRVLLHKLQESVEPSASNNDGHFRSSGWWQKRQLS